MEATLGSASRQSQMFARSKQPNIAIEENHRLVLMADTIDWTGLEELVEGIRRRKLKNRAGKKPHLRALIGSLLVPADRSRPYRDTADQIRHYAPARYLCGLTETNWSPSKSTIHDFAKLMGEDGIREINEFIVKEAVRRELADPSVLVADMTAQEAAIPYPTEIGHMASFLSAVAAASKAAGGVLGSVVGRVATELKSAKEKVRSHRLFAKTKEEKDKLTTEIVEIVEVVQEQVGKALVEAGRQKDRAKGYAKVAKAKVQRLHETMKKLVPQIQYWLKTGRVAAKKIINIHIPELYSVVRGKAGKEVEFGLKWGIARLRGGFILATVAKDSLEMVDTTFVVTAVDDHIAMFGKAPRSYGYDRGGHSEPNVEELKRKGVEEVGVAPRGNTPWSVTQEAKKRLTKERAKVEGSIGTVKCKKYGFNRPDVRSVGMMAACGQRAVLGCNLNTLVRKTAKLNKIAVVGG